MKKLQSILSGRRYDVKRVYGSKKPLYIVGGVSAGLTSIFILIGFLNLTGVLPGEWFGFNGIDFLVLGVLSAIGPIGFYNHLEAKKKKEVENHLPDFLREISSSTASGMTIFDAINAAAQGEHGQLTPELRRMSAQLSWGISVKEALNNFAERINTNAVKRMAVTVNKALEIGGNTSAVFEAAAREIDQVKRVELQRKTEMSMYSIVIFISFFVFLAVMLIIDKTIFQAIFDLQDQMAGQSIGNLRIAQIDHNLLKYTFFAFVMVQSIGGGLLGGFMMDGRLSSGVRFGFILVVISFIVFKFFF
ncbi:MAG TPA: type II secretion system F family protein [Thermoplasmatales archaeon]|nr:type II secretion system F family protein [Thermoplasmatales archaeon]